MHEYIEECAVFLSLLSLDDDEIEAVMAAARTWCDNHEISIASDQGRFALTVALETVGETTSAAHLIAAIDRRLNASTLMRRAA